MQSHEGARGSIGLVSSLMVFLLGLVLLVVVTTSRAAVQSARAQSVADAAALAAALDGLSAAQGLAEHNGARLLGYSARGFCVEVRIALGRSQARARAQAIVGSVPAPCA